MNVETTAEPEHEVIDITHENEHDEPKSNTCKDKKDKNKGEDNQSLITKKKIESTTTQEKTYARAAFPERSKTTETNIVNGATATKTTRKTVLKTNKFSTSHANQSTKAKKSVTSIEDKHFIGHGSVLNEGIVRATLGKAISTKPKRK